MERDKRNKKKCIQIYNIHIKYNLNTVYIQEYGNNDLLNKCFNVGESKR